MTNGKLDIGILEQRSSLEKIDANAQITGISTQTQPHAPEGSDAQAAYTEATWSAGESRTRSRTRTVKTEPRGSVRDSLSRGGRLPNALVVRKLQVIIRRFKQTHQRLMGLDSDKREREWAELRQMFMAYRKSMLYHKRRIHALSLQLTKDMADIRFIINQASDGKAILASAPDIEKLELFLKRRRERLRKANYRRRKRGELYSMQAS